MIEWIWPDVYNKIFVNMIDQKIIMYYDNNQLKTGHGGLAI